MHSIGRLLPACAAMILLTAACGHQAEAPTASVTGRVCDPEGKAIEGVTVSGSTALTAMTGADGNYSFDDIPAGEQSFTFSAEDYISQSRTVTLPAGLTYHLDITMEPDPVVRSIVFTPESLDFGTDESVLSMRVEPDLRKGCGWSLDTGDCPWLSADPAQGFIATGEALTLTFRADRTAVTNFSRAVSVLNIGGNSYAIISSIEPRKPETVLTATPTELDFGSGSTELPLNVTIKSPGTHPWKISSGHEAIKLSLAGGSTINGTTDILLNVSLDRRLFSGRLESYLTLICADEELSVPVTAVNPSASDLADIPDDFAYSLDASGLPATLTPPLIDSPEWTIALNGKIEADGTILWSEASGGQPVCILEVREGRLRYIAGAENCRFNSAEKWWDFNSSSVTGDGHRIVLTQTTGDDIRTVRLYIDGERASEIYYASDTPTEAASLKIGVACPRPGNVQTVAAPMQLKSLRIYTRALGTAEIEALAAEK